MVETREKPGKARDGGIDIVRKSLVRKSQGGKIGTEVSTL
jgi:hypothetical protein